MNRRKKRARKFYKYYNKSNFDGNDDYVDIPSIDFGEDFSFCGFIIHERSVECDKVSLKINAIEKNKNK